MKKAWIYFICLGLCMASVPARSAVTIKKAAPVATKEKSATDLSGSFLPTVVNLVTGVKELKQAQQKMTADCVPSASDIRFVNDMMKEWAKTGTMSAEKVRNTLALSSSGMDKCLTPNGYAESVRSGMGVVAGASPCYDYFGSSSDIGQIWEGYPKASVAYYNPTGAERDKVTVSNIYEIFSLIDFQEADLSKSDWATAGKILEKLQSCSSVKLSAKKREMWGEFLTNTINNVGKKTETQSVMEMVTNLTSSLGNTNSALGGVGSTLTQVAGQFINK